MVAVVVDVDDPGQVLVVEHRPRQHDLATRRRRRAQQVLLRSHDSRQRGDDLLPDRVQRRIGDLREQLDEVVVEQARALRQRRDGGVGAHRPERLATRGGHRGEQDPQVLLGVAERALAAHHRVVVVQHTGTVGQRVEPEPARVQPLVVGMFRGELGLDLLVGHDAPRGGVDKEHPPGLQPTLGDDVVGFDGEHAGLAGEDHPAVDGAPPTPGAQPVAVEHRADDRAVGERHAGRSVPRLHQRGVVLVERAPARLHGVVVLPRLGDHHHHHVRQRPAAEVEQFEDLVEGRGVRRLRGADREEPAQVAGDEIAGQHRLAGAHAVAVTAHGVDLTVVRDEPERVRERPGREGVGGEPAVHDRDRGQTSLVTQVREVQRQLRGGEHALVDHGARGQRREVHAGACGRDLGRDLLGPLAQGERATVEVDAADPGVVIWLGGDEQLAHVGHAGERGPADVGTVDVDRDLAPAEDIEPLLGRDGLDAPGGDRALRLRHRQEPDARGEGVRAVGQRFRQCEGGGLAQQFHRQLDQDARAVTAVRLGARRAAVVEVLEGEQSVGDDPVRATALDVRDHRDAAGIRLVVRVVQALRRRELGEEHRNLHVCAQWISPGQRRPVVLGGCPSCVNINSFVHRAPAELGPTWSHAQVHSRRRNRCMPQCC